MNRRVWTGILAGVLAATVLLGVAGGAYRAGQNHEVVTRVVPDGQVVQVVGDRSWGHGGPGFLLFPLLIVGLVFLAVRGRGRGGGWRGGCAPYAGPPPWAQARSDEAFRDWHRRAHEDPPSRSEPAEPAEV